MVLYPNQEKSKTKELKQLNINAMGRRIMGNKREEGFKQRRIG